ncbi:hypothetical protein BFAG_01799 [Bacteroides fragilis 3_1_12]|uniref:Uncharacterized protein n=1 Tax=Bacteroides fragilis 3_1_12 TaxID=457424 RepID=A0ABN0BJP3_BACFG|nr:hypothetical protein BFAG_01799 [Bacteroides fragilis 3_1_12]
MWAVVWLKLSTGGTKVAELLSMKKLTTNHRP